MFCYEHPHPAVSVDVAVFRHHGGQLEVLLIQRAVYPFKGRWGLPGGFVGIAEKLEAAAHRELAEETGLEGLELEQVQAFGDPYRDPRERVITVAYYGLVPAEAPAARAASDASDVAWFSLDALPALAFDHEQIVATARQRAAAALGA